MTAFPIFRIIAAVFVVCGVLAACAVMPADLRQRAVKDRPFDQLLRESPSLKGQTVIVGGYVIAVENSTDRSVITAVQAPLKMGQEPGAKDKSQGRLILVTDGFIDPEVYVKDRKITAGGVLAGSSAITPGARPYPFVQVKVESLHLWAKPSPATYDPFWSEPYYPYGRYRFGPHYPYW